MNATRIALGLSLLLCGAAHAEQAPAPGEVLIKKVKPSKGDLEGGGRVELVGSGFDVKMKIEIGGKACTDLWVPDISKGRRAQCTIAAGKKGKVDVKATVGAKVVTKAGGYTYYSPEGWDSLPKSLRQLAAISILLFVIILVIARLPEVKLDTPHSKAFKRRRIMNWLPLGLTYAFLYMGRYNLTVSKNALGDLMSKADFGTIFFWGTLTYGCAFLINGPLTDKYGGRITMLIGSAGSAAMNILLGVVTWGMLTQGWNTDNLVVMFSAIYAVNMYFQSFGAVSIVKVNASWFHVHERGVFGAIFGILISLGVYFAFDVSSMIVGFAESGMTGTGAAGVWWVFFTPAIMLVIFHTIDQFLVRNTPSDTGHPDFDTADASSGEDEGRLPVFVVAKKMLTNPVILTIALIEFCSGFLRNAIMHWYIIFAKETGIMASFVPQNWGLLLCCAGIMGGVFAGIISDRVFQSRRGPVAAILYGGMVLGSLGLMFILDTPYVGWLVVFMSLCIIGVHGMLSGTASMDFGGKKNVGVAVGIIDGLVYLGTAVQSVYYGWALPKKGQGAENPANWDAWPTAMIVVAIIGCLLATRVWNAKPKGKSAGAH